MFFRCRFYFYSRYESADEQLSQLSRQLNRRLINVFHTFFLMTPAFFFLSEVHGCCITVDFFSNCPPHQSLLLATVTLTALLPKKKNPKQALRLNDAVIKRCNYLN